jgi:hypothetical protein
MSFSPVRPRGERASATAPALPAPAAPTPAAPVSTPVSAAPAAAAGRPGPGAPTGSRFRSRSRPWAVNLPLSSSDRDVLWLYLLTRVGLWTTAYCARWVFPADSTTRHVASVLSSWQQWDWGYYLHIAKDGYFPGLRGPWTDGWDNREAFFPGFPLLLRAVHTVVPSWAAAGLLISFAAGAAAVLALARIARLDSKGGESGDGGDHGQRTVLFFLLSPCAVFLAAGYTEALFLALALPAWVAARRSNWPLAAILTALATTVRVSGLFVAAAVAVQFLVTVRAGRQWRSLPWLALPALPAVLYSWYLHTRTGDWMAWKHAENRGWYREFHSPWQAWRRTWQAAFDHQVSTGYAVEFRAELLAMAVGLLLLALLVVRRRWPEAVYIALSLWALGTSYWYMSVPRGTLLWWPLWTLLAGWSLKRPRVRTVYLSVAAPVMTVVALTFLSGRWAG